MLVYNNIKSITNIIDEIQKYDVLSENGNPYETINTLSDDELLGYLNKLSSIKYIIDNNSNNDDINELIEEFINESDINLK